MIYDSALGFICYIHELRKKYGREFQEYISAHCLLCSNQLFDFFLLDKSSMVNDVPENDNFCLNPVSSWRCGLWSPHSSPYSLQVLGQSYYFQTRVISQADLDIWLSSSVDQALDALWCFGADHQYPIVSVTLLQRYYQ